MNKFFLLGIALMALSCSREPLSIVTEHYTPDAREQKVWSSLMEKGVDKIVFTKRNTYNSNHYYTEFLNGDYRPGGNIYTLSLKDGEVRELVPSLKGGIFGKFDISFDASKIVFAYKADYRTGYRIYEVGVDGNGLRQLTFNPQNEDQLLETYKLGKWFRRTEDLDPCYLPDGGIAFISTRCRYGTLCDPPDLFSTTVLYRMDADGNNMKRLSNNALSENTPCVLDDGRILYTRWEYVDKGAVAVKCLWAMMPDGSGSTEIYGNDVDFPTTMIMARPIPGSSTEYVFTGTPHYPQNCLGTVVRVDVTKDLRTKEPMTYMTPYVDIRSEPGFHFKDSVTGEWVWDRQGHGPLFRETYPLSRSEFIVSHKPAGPVHNDPKAYDLYLLNEKGEVFPIYSDTAISCFNPMPLRARKRPPVIPSKVDNSLASQNLAECIVTDVYQGLEDVERGAVKYIRVLEQVPRPWSARRFYPGDEYDQQHSVVTKDTHLGLKVQHGIVKVEEDGSARFLVPADKNIFFQVLDSNYMAIQTERTFVNFIPGEIRSCVGCHETQSQTPRTDGRKTPIAMGKKPELPVAQPGDAAARRTLSYAADVQPVWDRHCVSCHSGEKPAGNLNLSGEETRLFNVSYENLVPERRNRKTGYFDRGLVGLTIGENHPKTGNIHYLPAKSMGSYSSVLVGMLAADKITLKDPANDAKAKELAKKHCKIKLTDEEILKVSNWIDINCQYYGSYYGKRNMKYKEYSDFRKEYSFDVAISQEAPEPVVLKEK